MRILNTRQIRELDSYTIQHEPIASIDLMERASRAFADWFCTKVDTDRKVCVVCGTGNNGGDGLAIARLLSGWGYAVTVQVVRGGVPESEDFAINHRSLPQTVTRVDVTDDAGIRFGDCDVIVDAIFGSGLSRPPAGLYAKVIEAVNAARALRIAVDIPSGLMADSHSTGAIVRADYTVTFQLPKLAFMLPGSYPFTGEWVVVNIGLDKKFMREAASDYRYTQLKDVSRMIRPRSKYDHKGTFGHALLVAGSHGKIGAAVLAARAALRSGLGLLTVHLPGCGYDVMQTAVPEAMVHTDQDHFVFSEAPALDQYATVGVGPGLGKDARTRAALRKMFETFRKPMVLDADALNILAEDRELFQHVPPQSILTPHPKEFERLAGASKDDFQRLEMLQELASSRECVVLLKGAHTAVASPDGRVHFNSTGNPGMATGGTGDVLTGVLTGLLAQHYTSIEAAVMGVFLHGLAGDVAAETLGMHSLTASNVVEHLPAAFKKAVSNKL